MRYIACIVFLVRALPWSAAQGETACDRASREAIAVGNVAQELCYGRIDPEAEHHDISVFERCLSKGQEALIRVDEAESACSNEGANVLAEIAEYRDHITNMMKTVELKKRMEEGSVTPADALEEMLRQPE